MAKQYIGVSIVLAILVGAIALGMFFGGGPGGTEGHEEPAAVLASYTLSEVGAHASADDCWLAVDGKVYDVTSYVSGGTHPGGQGALVSGCGNDETERFGKIHSPHAAEELEGFLIGVLAK